MFGQLFGVLVACVVAFSAGYLYAKKKFAPREAPKGTSGGGGGGPKPE